MKKETISGREEVDRYMQQLDHAMKPDRTKAPGAQAIRERPGFIDRCMIA
jgi:hypothetical protein